MLTECQATVRITQLSYNIASRFKFKLILKQDMRIVQRWDKCTKQRSETSPILFAKQVRTYSLGNTETMCCSIAHLPTWCTVRNWCQTVLSTTFIKTPSEGNIFWKNLSSKVLETCRIVETALRWSWRHVVAKYLIKTLYIGFSITL